MPNKEFRARARFYLQGAWGPAILACLIGPLIAGTLQSVFSSVIGFFGNLGILRDIMFSVDNFNYLNPEEQQALFFVLIPRMLGLGALLAIFNFLVQVLFAYPFNIGVYNWFLLNRENPQAPNLNIIFRHFGKNYGKLVLGALWQNFFLFLWSGIPRLIAGTVLLIPFITAGFNIFDPNTWGNLETQFDGTLYALCILIFYILIIIANFIMLNRSLAYSQQFYILADNPHIGTKRSLELSKEMMKGRKLKAFGLGMSFFGWFILAALTCGVGTIFLLPYMNQTFAEFYSYVRGQSVVRGLTSMEELGFVYVASPAADPSGGQFQQGATSPGTAEPYQPAQNQNYQVSGPQNYLGQSSAYSEPAPSQDQLTAPGQNLPPTAGPNLSQPNYPLEQDPHDQRHWQAENKEEPNEE